MKRQFSLVAMVVLLGSGTALAGSGTPGSYVNDSHLFADTLVSKPAGFDRKAIADGVNPNQSQWEVSFRKITAFDEAAFDQYSIRLQQVLKEGSHEKTRSARQLEKKQKHTLKGLLLSFEAPGKWS